MLAWATRLRVVLPVNGEVPFKAVQEPSIPSLLSYVPCDVNGFHIGIVDFDPNRLALKHDAIRGRHVVIHMGAFLIRDSKYDVFARKRRATGHNEAGVSPPVADRLDLACSDVECRRKCYFPALIMMLAAIFNTVFFWRWA